MRCLFLICLVCTVAFCGCGGGGGGSTTTTTSTPPATTSVAVTASAGGTVAAPSGTRVVIPAGALAADTTIKVTPISALVVPLIGSQTMLAAATFEPTGTTFATPATITFPIANRKPAGAKLLLLVLNEATGKWNAATSAVVAADGLSVTASVSHFSIYVLTDAATVASDMFFLFSTGAETTVGPNDLGYDGAQSSIFFNHAEAKAASNYPSITAATAGGYAVGPVPVQVGTVLMVHSYMTGGYYKMIVADVAADHVSFVYQTITAPPAVQ